MKNSKVEKPGKVYVVAKKNGSTQATGKGGTGKFKFVDKRMKSDVKRGSKKQREHTSGRSMRISNFEFRMNFVYIEAIVETCITLHLSKEDTT